MKLFICLWLLFYINCAKKLPPPSPDFFPPEINEVLVPTRHTIKILFDEEIDPAVSLLDFKILTMKQETLRIRNCFTEKNTLTLITQSLSNESYRLIGKVRDKRENVRNLNIKFRGNEKRDTIKPYLKRIFFNDRITLSFSEPMDTTANLFYLLSQPTKLETLWSRDWQNLYLLFKEKKTITEPIYFIIFPTLKDLEGNLLENGGSSFYLPDTAIKLSLLFGKVFLEKKTIANALVLFKKDGFNAFTLSERTGNFAIKIPPGQYEINVLYDLGQDWMVDYIFQPFIYNVEKDTTLIFDLIPVSEKRRTDEYLK